MAGGTVSTLLAVIACITVIAIQIRSTNSVKQSLALHNAIICWIQYFIQWLCIEYNDHILNTVTIVFYWWAKVV